MRFAKDGPNIPDELLVARDEGRVVFFCGAGVSRSKAGLKDFIGLARSVADKLSIPDERPARQLINAIDNIPTIEGVGSLISADRVFGLMERDFLSRDIYRAIAESLRPSTSSDLTAHRLLLELAKGPDGTTRLITTNFDLLFEECDSTIPVLSPPRLPNPLRGDEFNGIIHLHGHVTADYSNAAGDGFIISSAEFGRAYLSDRWAADFIRTVLEQFFVVFVGYSADDPPMQYLLEALNRSAGSLSGAYAFQSGSFDDAEARWVQKGVKPIVYDYSKDHTALWDTISLWAERARDPNKWHDNLLLKAQLGPEKCEPYVRGQVAHVVSTLEGAKRVAQAAEPMPADWLCTFDPLVRFAKPGRTGSLIDTGIYFDPFNAYGIDSDPVPAHIDPDNVVFENRDLPANAWNAFALTRLDRQNLQEDQVSALRGHWSTNAPRLAARMAHIAHWLQRVAHQPASVWWAASQIGIHPEVQRTIRYSAALGGVGWSPEVRKAWQYLTVAWSHRRDASNDHYQLVDEINLDGWSLSAIREFANIHRPRIKIGRPFTGSPKAPNKLNFELRDLIHLDVEYPSHDFDAPVTADFLAALLKELRTNLELGSALEEEIGGYGLHNLNSIAVDEQSSSSERTYKSGINVPIFEYLKIFMKLLEVNVKAAKREMEAWRGLSGPVAAHFRIWSLGDSRLVSRSELASVLRAISREEFWASSHQGDLLIALEKRWREFANKSKRSLEKRLLQGRKRWRTEAVEEFKQRRASATLSRIHWLAQKGCDFSFNLDEVTENLRKDFPDWQKEWSGGAVYSTGSRTGWVTTDTRIDDLLDIPLNEVLDAATKLSGRSQELFVERDPYAGLSDQKPARAFSALTAAGKKGIHPTDSWRTFLNREARKKDSPRFVTVIAIRLSLLPDDTLLELLRPASDWLLKISSLLLSHRRDVMDQLWIRIIGLLAAYPEHAQSSIVRGSQQPDWATEALNSPVGYLAQIMLSDPAIKEIKAGEEFPSWWKTKIEELLDLPGDGRAHALAILCHNLVWLFAIDQDWVAKEFLPVIELQNHYADAFWAGFFWGAKVPQPALYALMKVALLSLAHRNSETRRKHAEILAGIILSGWGTTLDSSKTRLVSDAELTAVLVNADDDFRTQLIWHLESWSKAEKSLWTEDAVILLTRVWPKQIAIKTPRVSGKLAELAFSQGDRFPEFVDYILPLVVPIDQDYINLPILRREKNNLVDKYPEQMLAILHAILTDNARQWPYGISEILNRIGAANPKLLTDSRLIRLNKIRNSF